MVVINTAVFIESYVPDIELSDLRGLSHLSHQTCKTITLMIPIL